MKTPATPTSDPVPSEPGTADLFRRLDEEEIFRFDCTPDRCDLRCCTTGHPLVLNPFEIGRISRVTGLSFETLYEDYFETTRDPVTGMPLMTINREKGCRFLKDRSCTVYTARPLVCRLFPLGKFYDEGFRYVLLSKNPCAGFEADRRQTAAGYRTEQQTAVEDRMWEIWVEFLNRMEQIEMPGSDLFATTFSMFVYNTDVVPPGVEEAGTDGPDEEALLRARLKMAAEALPGLRKICLKHATPDGGVV